MIYRGVVQGGVVIIKGDKPADGTVVHVQPAADDLSRQPEELPGFGLWRNRQDIPDSGEASLVLRRQIEQRANQ